MSEIGKGAGGPVDKDPPPDYSAVNERTLLDWHQTTSLNEALARQDGAPNLPDYSAVNEPITDVDKAPPTPPPDPPEELVTSAGLQPVVGVSHVLDYRDELAAETAWKDATATRATSYPEEEGPIDNPLGQQGRWGNFGPENTRAESIKIESGIWVAQYYDSSKEVGDRSLKYWEPIRASQLSTLTDRGRMEAVKERAALVEEWGDRNMVQVAFIPAGTEISVISGPASPQVEHFKKDEHGVRHETRASIIERTDFADNAALPEILSPDDEVLKAIGDVRLGGGTQLLFAEFDEAWIVGRGAVGP